MFSLKMAFLKIQNVSPIIELIKVVYRLYSLLFYLLVSVAEIHLCVQGYVTVSPVVYFALDEMGRVAQSL